MSTRVIRNIETKNNMMNMIYNYSITIGFMRLFLLKRHLHFPSLLLGILNWKRVRKRGWCGRANGGGATQATPWRRTRRAQSMAREERAERERWRRCERTWGCDACERAPQREVTARRRCRDMARGIRGTEGGRRRGILCVP